MRPCEWWARLTCMLPKSKRTGACNLTLSCKSLFPFFSSLRAVASRAVGSSSDPWLRESRNYVCTAQGACVDPELSDEFARQLPQNSSKAAPWGGQCRANKSDLQLYSRTRRKEQHSTWICGAVLIALPHLHSICSGPPFEFIRGDQVLLLWD